jgi:GT2 family glycosyltransferase
MRPILPTEVTMASDFLALDKPTTQPVSALGPLASILVPCCGMREYTKLLIPSLLKHTRPPFELIFLDIGSLDGTAEYLEGLAAGLPQVRIEIVRAATDLDLPGAVKEALAKIRGDYVVLLNNDTVVTNAWLNQLIGLVNMSPAIGMAGPMSNYAAPPQLVESIPYRIASKKSFLGANGTRQGDLLDISAVERFAAEFRESNKGKWLEAERLGGFCLLLKREVLRRVTNQGQLDKWTDLSLFDTDILSAKAREAGFTLAVCRDLFVHHFGTRTFAHGAPAANGKSGTSS